MTAKTEQFNIQRIAELENQVAELTKQMVLLADKIAQLRTLPSVSVNMAKRFFDLLQRRA